MTSKYYNNDELMAILEYLYDDGAEWDLNGRYLCSRLVYALNKLGFISDD